MGRDCVLQDLEPGYGVIYKQYWVLPVVHEHVWLPQLVGGDPQVLHSAVLRVVPSQVVIIPLLKHLHVYPTLFKSQSFNGNRKTTHIYEALMTRTNSQAQNLAFKPVHRGSHIYSK